MNIFASILNMFLAVAFFAGVVTGIIWLFGGSPDFRTIFWIVFVVNILLGLGTALINGLDRGRF